MTTSDGPRRVGDFLALSEPGAGPELYVLPTRKFKTRVLRIHLRCRVDERSCVRSLLPNLLRRGSRSHPSMVHVARALEQMYGASWSASTYRLGEDQVLCFRLESVDEALVPGRPPLTRDTLELCRELICEPALDDAGLFPSAVFEQERLNLRREVEAQYNDKHSFALQRLQEELFPGEPYGQPLLGTPESVNALTGEMTRQALHEMHALPARIFVVGDVDPAAMARWAATALPFPSAPRVAPPWQVRREPAASRFLTEPDAISQSKLVLGYLVDMADLEPVEFEALRLYASVLGGGSHSRLFLSVRERHSLAYYASASLDRLKGVLYVSCGIDAADRSRVEELIAAEMESLVREVPSAEEFQQSLRTALSSTRTVVDSPGGLIDVLDGGLACDRPRAIDEITAALERVTPEDVRRVSRRIGPLRVSYCLQGESRHDAA